MYGHSDEYDVISATNVYRCSGVFIIYLEIEKLELDLATMIRGKWKLQFELPHNVVANT